MAELPGAVVVGAEIVDGTTPVDDAESGGARHVLDPEPIVSAGVWLLHVGVVRVLEQFEEHTVAGVAEATYPVAHGGEQLRRGVGILDGLP